MKVSLDLFDSNNGFFHVNENYFPKVYQIQFGQEILQLQKSLQAIQLKVDETYALLTKERESACEAIEETSAINTGLEEAKGQEILKLKNSLKAMEAKADETNALLIKEREFSLTKIDKLSTEVKELKSLLESERNRANEFEKKCSEALVTSEIKQQKVAEKPQKSPNEKQKEYHDLINRCITQHLGFSNGRPVAACIIYKCLNQWRSSGLEISSLYDRIIQTIGQVIEKQDNYRVLPYWLSNTSTLLLLLQHVLEQDEATLLFKLQLTAYVEKIYVMICDNLKEEISPFLKLCIQSPKLSTGNLLMETGASHWLEIVNNLNSFLNMLKSNNVPPFFIRKIFMQNFCFINTHLFNSIIVRKECCTYSNGEYVKAGLSELENWCYNATEEVSSAWDELKHTREAIGFLVIHQKSKMKLDEIRDVCPVLNIQQLHGISTTYWDDKYGTHSLSPDVISNMRMIMEIDEHNFEAKKMSLLLGFDVSRIPFSVDDLFKSMDEINVEDVELPSFICNNSDFSFLKVES